MTPSLVHEHAKDIPASGSFFALIRLCAWEVLPWGIRVFPPDVQIVHMLVSLGTLLKPHLVRKVTR